MNTIICDSIYEGTFTPPGQKVPIIYHLYEVSIKCRFFLPVLVVTFLSGYVRAEYNLTDHLIRPLSLNRRGSIGPGRSCPTGKYAIGMNE